MKESNIAEKILEDPLKVTESELWDLLQTDPEIFVTLRRLTLRLFDMNESSLLEASDAQKGFLGWCNRISQRVRTRQYNRKIKSVHRIPADQRVVIVAEGDSWFQFPIFVKDVLDWLKTFNSNYIIYSVAFAGDWMTNMIYEGKYVEELSVHRPDVFLISGGGNDLVGANKLALMVHNNRHDRNCRKYGKADEIRNFSEGELSKEDKDEIFEVQDYITKEFYSFILILKLQYMGIVSGINRKYKDTIIVCNGYDYAIPSYSIRFDLRYPLKSAVNWFVGTGKWLVRPMRIKGILDSERQRKIVKALIYELNIMLDDLAVNPNFSNFFRAHTVGLFRKREDWFDELHLKSHSFQLVAKIFGKLINDKIELKRRAALTPGIREEILEKVSQEKKVYTVEDVTK